MSLLAACGSNLGQLEVRLSQNVSTNSFANDVVFPLVGGTSTTFTASRSDLACSRVLAVTGRAWRAGDHYSLVQSASLEDGDVATLRYSEGCDDAMLKTWLSVGGTFVLDELIGSHADIRFDFAAMSADLTTASTGTFNFTGRGYSETVTISQ